jgi:raffinose/stachyose/melibiose transport system permease protein
MLNSAFKENSEFIRDFGLKIPKKLSLDNFSIAWREGELGRYFLNSILYTFFGVIGVIIITSWAGYSFSRLEFWGKNLFFSLFLAAMMIPVPAGFVPLYIILTKMFKTGLLTPRLGYLLAMINVNLSLSIYLYKTFFDKLPTDLEDQARIDGCSKIGIWWHVALPLAKPATGVVSITSALWIWNEFVLASLILPPSALPLQAGLMRFQGEYIGNFTVIMAGLTIAFLPIVIIYFFLQRHIIKGLTAGAIVG